MDALPPPRARRLYPYPQNMWVAPIAFPLGISRSVGECGAVLAVDGDMKACSVYLHGDVDRHVEHVRPSWKHVLFLFRR